MEPLQFLENEIKFKGYAEVSFLFSYINKNETSA